MESKPALVIIPGIGDDLKIYQTFAKRWRSLGYEVYVISFGWFEHRAVLTAKFENFLEKFDEIKNKNIYVVGVSAGGPAAIQLLAERPHIRKVITICSPLDTMPYLRNPLLAASIDRARDLLRQFTKEQKNRILSVFALHDPVVHIRLSQPEGIETLRLPIILHPVAIYVALMFYARKLDNFLKR